MKSLTIFLAISLIISVNFTLLSQDEQMDKGQFIEKKNEFWEKIEKSANEYQAPDKKPKQVFKMDFSGYKYQLQLNNLKDNGIIPQYHRDGLEPAGLFPQLHI